MAVPNDIQYGTHTARHAALGNDDGQARTRTLGALVAIMVVAGVVALVLTLFGDNSNNSSAATQPSGSQVGKQTTSASSTTPSTSPASSTTSSASAPASTVPATSAPASTKPASTTAAPKPAKTSASTGTSSKIVKYTVKKGDNLTLIAKWFRQRGVGPVYDWNKSIIGRNPNLIFPGQTIIVSLTGDKMTKVSTGSN